jgi:hypothetical protein
VVSVTARPRFTTYHIASVAFSERKVLYSHCACVGSDFLHSYAVLIALLHAAPTVYLLIPRPPPRLSKLLHVIFVSPNLSMRRCDGVHEARISLLICDARPARAAVTCHLTCDSGYAPLQPTQHYNRCAILTQRVIPCTGDTSQTWPYPLNFRRLLPGKVPYTVLDPLNFKDY